MAALFSRLCGCCSPTDETSVAPPKTSNDGSVPLLIKETRRHPVNVAVAANGHTGAPVEQPVKKAGSGNGPGKLLTTETRRHPSGVLPASATVPPATAGSSVSTGLGPGQPLPSGAAQGGSPVLKGCHGIENLGATGYLSAWLHLMYHTPLIRKAIQSLPPSLGPGPTGMALAASLQTVMTQMDFASAPVSPVALTLALGLLSPQQLAEQQDLWEFHCATLGALLEDAQGQEPPALREAGSPLLRELEWSVDNYVEGLTSDYRACRPAHPWGVTLSVDGLGSLQEALADFGRPELLAGPNGIMTDAGTVDCVRGVRLARLPPILMLHLKRYKYNSATAQLDKLHSQLSYPEVLDMAAITAAPVEGAAGGAGSEAAAPAGSSGLPLLSSELLAGPREELVYRLAAVVSHTGSAVGGSYCVVCRVGAGAGGADGQWMRLQDTQARPVQQRDAIEELYGNGQPGCPTAYVLVYVRQSAWPDAAAK